MGSVVITFPHDTSLREKPVAEEDYKTRDKNSLITLPFNVWMSNWFKGTTARLPGTAQAASHSIVLRHRAPGSLPAPVCIHRVYTLHATRRLVWLKHSCWPCGSATRPHHPRSLRRPGRRHGFQPQLPQEHFQAADPRPGTINRFPGAATGAFAERRGTAWSVSAWSVSAWCPCVQRASSSRGP